MIREKVYQMEQTQISLKQKYATKHIDPLLGCSGLTSKLGTRTRSPCCGASSRPAEARQAP